MRGLPAIAVASLTLTLALAPQTARAWTSATVRTARAEVELTPAGGAHVTLWARVRVDGGWLEGMEIEGLDEDAVLDGSRPLTFRDATGAALPVIVTPRDGGRVSLRFTRRTAPRRGEYDVELAWSTSLRATRALDADTLEAHWVFPAWRYGLDAVEVRWIVPPGSRAESADELTAPIEITSEPLVTDGLDRILVTHRRAHLPRTSDWDTIVRVPSARWPHAAAAALVDAQELPPEVASSDPPRPSSASDLPAPSERSVWLALASIVAIGSLLKRRDLEARARRAHQATRWLVPSVGWLHPLASVAGLGVAAATFVEELPPTGSLVSSALLVALAWQRRALDPPRPRVLALSAVSSAEQRRAGREAITSWLGPAALFEPTRLGAVTAAGALAASLDADPPARLFAALVVALVAAGSRAQLARSPEHAVRALTRAMRGMRLDLGAPYVSLRLMGRGVEAPSDVRLRIGLSDEGARGRLLADLRLELVASEGLALRVAAREETPADIALRAWAEREGRTVHEVARRRAVLVPVSLREVGPTVERVARDVLALAPHDPDATAHDGLLAAA